MSQYLDTSEIPPTKVFLNFFHYFYQSSSIRTKKDQYENILLTGSTGFLGGFLLWEILQNFHIKKVYCLVRGNDEISARSKLIESMKEKGK